MFWMRILGLISPIIEKAVPDTAAAARLKADISAALLSGSKELEQAKADIITAEATAESWLTRSWRPIAMLNFLLLLNLYWFGIAPEYVVQDKELTKQLFTLLTIGIGGYGVGRSFEKVAGKVAGMMGGGGAGASPPA